jgi:S-adenosylmethionine synthetase
MTDRHIFTSESVTEGHPDKVCDYIADSVLDACLEKDPRSRVACEVLCKGNQIVLAGEITTDAELDYVAIARQAVREIGYTDHEEAFCDSTSHVHLLLSRQSQEISQGVSRARPEEQGAGDQGIMFGYATDETPELMPLPILLAHRLSRGLATHRKTNRVPWLLPDGKTQVSVLYENEEPREVTAVVVSCQHRPGVTQGEIRGYVQSILAPEALGSWFKDGIEFHVNPTGSFVHGGPSTDCGVTGRKIIVDTYGGMARHGGGAFSGKDPSKVDRSAAYFCRHAARQAVLNRLAKRAEIQVAYAIGEARPISVRANTFGTGDEGRVARFVHNFDFRPYAFIESLHLKRPIYRRTTNYGHFGKPDLPWEQ